MSAAAMGATAFQKGLGAIHSLSHPIGALYDTHHGMTNAVFMPYVLANNRNAIEERIVRLAAYCGISGGFDGFAATISKLRAGLKVPNTLGGLIKDLAMDDARKDLVAEMAIVDPTAGGNPIPLTKQMALDLLNKAISGEN
jgi:alcohol dehydrogenase class IV